MGHAVAAVAATTTTAAEVAVTSTATSAAAVAVLAVHVAAGCSRSWPLAAEMWPTNPLQNLRLRRYFVFS